MFSFLLGCGAGYYGITKMNAIANNTTLYSYFRVLFYIVLVFYALFVISTVLTVVTDNKHSTDFMVVVSYEAILMALFCTFMGRLHVSFNNTYYKLSKTGWIILF